MKEHHYIVFGLCFFIFMLGKLLITFVSVATSCHVIYNRIHKAMVFKEGESDMLKNQFVNNYFDDGLLFKEDFVVKGRQMPFFLEVFL